MRKLRIWATIFSSITLVALFVALIIFISKLTTGEGNSSILAFVFALAAVVAIVLGIVDIIYLAQKPNNTSFLGLSIASIVLFNTIAGILMLIYSINLIKQTKNEETKPLVCHTCRERVLESDVFCPSCGAKIKK